MFVKLLFEGFGKIGLVELEDWTRNVLAVQGYLKEILLEVFNLKPNQKEIKLTSFWRIHRVTSSTDLLLTVGCSW